MNRGRRLASILVVASLGLGSLVGCQSEAGKAAFVGDTTITEDRVSQVFDEAVAKTPKQEPAPAASGSPAPPAEAPVTRQQVVDVLVSLELARRLVKEKSMPPVKEPLDAAAVGEARKISPDSEFVKLLAELYDLQAVIAQNTPAVHLTDAGIMKVYEAVAEIGAIQEGLSVEEVRQRFGEAAFAEVAIRVSTALGAVADTTDTKVNPKYDPVSAPMFVSTEQGPVFYELPYLASDMVTDVSL